MITNDLNVISDIDTENYDYFEKYKSIIKCAEEKNVNLYALAELLQLMKEPKLIFSYFSTFENILNTSLKSPPSAKNVVSFINNLHAQLIVTDATLPLVDLKKLFHKNLKEIMIGDPRNTKKMIKYIPDSAHISKTNLVYDLDRLYEFLIHSTNSLGIDKIMVVAPDKKWHKNLVKWFTKNFGQIPNLTYQRSELTMGVKCDKRIMINICAPNPPLKSFSWLKPVYLELQNYSNSELERYEMIKTFYQTTSRVKDPMTKVRSAVLCYGMEYRDITSILNNCIEAPEVLPTLHERKVENEKHMSIIVAQLWIKYGIWLGRKNLWMLRRFLRGHTDNEIYKQARNNHKKLNITKISDFRRLLQKIGVM